MALSDDEYTELTDLLQLLEPHVKHMNGRSADFVRQTIERHEQYKSDIRLSHAQWSWLRDLRRQHVKDHDTGLDRRFDDDGSPF